MRRRLPAIILRTLAAALLCVLGPTLAAPPPAAAQQAPAPGPRLEVAGPGGLMAALSRARGGEVIALAPGAYGKLVLTPREGIDLAFARPVTIASADPGNPAVFSGLDLRDAANLTFDGITFDYTFHPDHPISFKPFKITNGDDITIRNATFDGDLARGISELEDGAGWAFGLTVAGSRRVTVEKTEFFDFYRGLAVGGGPGHVVRGNEMHGIRMDGMNFTQVHDIVIEDNYFHRFRRSRNPADHADMIQFWTNGTTQPSTGITIRRNVIVAADDNRTQSIFMRNDMVDRGLAGREMFYRDVLIEENVIINGHVHGITLGESENVVIRRNTLLRNQSFARGENRQKKVTIPRINLKGASINVTVEGNLVDDPPQDTGRAGWTVRDNMRVQDISPMQPGYYHRVFADALIGDQQALDSFVYLPDSPAADPRIGAPLLQPGADRSRFAPRRRTEARRTGRRGTGRQGTGRQGTGGRRDGTDGWSDPWR